MQVTQAQLDAAFQAVRAWIDRKAGFYAGMIADADVQELCVVVLDAAASSPPSQDKEQT